MLTKKQEDFCLAYIETGSAIESYRRSYSASKMKPAGISVNAAKLLASTKIALRIADLRKPAADAAKVTLETHLIRLEALSTAAEKEGKYSAAVAAEIARGKASGLYIDKIEHSGEIKTPELKLVLHGTRVTPPAN